MAINTDSSPAGVNVNVGGAVQIDGQGLVSGTCNAANAGSIDVADGCYYYCDGAYRQAFNVAFNEGATPANPAAQTCNYDKRCTFDDKDKGIEIKLRPGDQVTAYKVERSANCAAEEAIIECKPDGTFDQPAFTFSYCMPRDQTSTGIIADYNPRDA